MILCSSYSWTNQALVYIDGKLNCDVLHNKVDTIFINICDILIIIIIIIIIIISYWIQVPH